MIKIERMCQDIKQAAYENMQLNGKLRAIQKIVESDPEKYKELTKYFEEEVIDYLEVENDGSTTKTI